MRFTFSRYFQRCLYQTLLQDLAKEMEDYRNLSGSRVKEMKADLHVSHETLKKCSTAKTSARSTMWPSCATSSSAFAVIGR